MLAMTSLATRTEPNDPLLPIQWMLPPEAPSEQRVAFRVVQSGPVGSRYLEGICEPARIQAIQRTRTRWMPISSICPPIMLPMAIIFAR
jgi:hypothetical protein